MIIVFEVGVCQTNNLPGIRYFQGDLLIPKSGVDISLVGGKLPEERIMGVTEDDKMNIPF